MASLLTPLQRDLLRAFFEIEDRFYLTGGAALAEFYLRHRPTEDLDLFVATNILDEGDRALFEAAVALGATVEGKKKSETFRRRVVTRGTEAVVVDLVVESVSQGTPVKPFIGKIRVDPPEEILANKMSTLLSRSEARDLVDVMHLLRQGLSLEEAMKLANRKDGGVTPAQVSWVLGQIEIPDGVSLPAKTKPSELRAFIADLRARLAAMAFPDSR